jgi:nitrite reductase/ring-hydroxylating ferredoxin subunit
MGEMMRRYWIPALLSEEISRPDGPPVQVRILGEELVAFRDSNGKIGLLAEHCSHRGTSLFYGRNEECGLRCIYHGWKYDVGGNVLDTPAEPPTSVLKHKIKHPAYPTHEVGGAVWAYLGPKEEMPAFPKYSWTYLPNDRLYATKALLECNWFQGLEGEFDVTHVNFLHRDFARGNAAELPMLEYETEETDFGMRLIAIYDGGPEKNHINLASFVMPLACWVPARNSEAHMYVPIDHTHTWRWELGWTQEPRRAGDPIPRSDQVGPDFRRHRRAENHYLIDREMQRTVNFTGLGSDFLSHDAMATESMGSLCDRTQEHLGTSDKALIAVRRYLLRTLDEFQRGVVLPHVTKDPEYPQGHIDAFRELMPKTASWRDHYPHLTKAGR